MKRKTLLLCLLFALPLHAADPIPNRLIDYAGFQKIVIASAETREQNRLTEVRFLELMREPGTLLLDARSPAMFALRHVEGAINLPYPDFTAESLGRVIPSSTKRILIYCNNNFLGSPVSFASKVAPASLNLATYAALAAYGYTNIFELGPLLNVATTQIPFAGTEVGK